MQEIEMRAIGTLKPNDANPRVIKEDKYEKLVASLKQFPEMLEARPIVVDPNGVILGGNMRWKAAKEAGLKKVPVYEASWDETKRKEFVIKDNVPFGEWDWDILANEWDSSELGEWGLDVWKAEGDIDTFFDDPELPEPNLKSASALVLQYSKEEYERITTRLAELDGTPEKIVWNLVFAAE